MNLSSFCSQFVTVPFDVYQRVNSDIVFISFPRDPEHYIVDYISIVDGSLALFVRQACDL